jgi:monoterpene epsilon-lactone hydrolase
VTTTIHLRGPLVYRLRSAATVGGSVIRVSVRRTIKGPRQPGWNWFFESCTQVLKRQLAIAFKMRDIAKARCHLDSVVFDSPVSAVDVGSVSHETFRGSWFTIKNTSATRTLLYLHGGGYSFYPKSYASFIARITLAAKARTFALDYRLSPEHKFPAQLEDALNAYHWLLENETDPGKLVLAGDSAGGNLALALLLAARDAELPTPALVVTLSPATCFERDRGTATPNQDLDWIDEEMLERWANWFCDSAQRSDPLVSPGLADLRGLPPIYIQAGRAEILYGSIQAFADRAKNQRANVVLETWDAMNHDFQIFGPDVPQSADALRRLGEVIDSRLRATVSPRALFAADS